MDRIEQAYLKILLEEDLSNEYWMKHGSYKNIDFYIRRDGHLQQRLKERYGAHFRLSNIFKIMQSFIKKSLNEGSFLSKKPDGSNPGIPYTFHATLSKIFISGRFKANGGEWRCQIATVLPNKDMHHNSSDYYLELDV